MEDKKTNGQLLNEKLTHSSEYIWEKIDEKEKELVFKFSEGYKKFLNSSKTERECAAFTVKMAEEKGFVSIDSLGKDNKLTPGMKVYQVNRNKSVVLAVIGKKGLENGVNIVGAHIDSPRIDLKQNPVYEDTGMVLLKTHYYGGIKKYQWVTIPLALHGVVVKVNGDVVDVNIGEEDNDPVFTITDLLPHLAQDQMQKKMSEAITGEGLNVLFGSIPYDDDKVKDKVKLNILKLLNDKYGITEEDFVSADLEIVPAFKASDVGLDRSFVGGYGQDDRVCSYAALDAILNTNDVDKTAICLLTDKEEIGSMGNTGAQSVFFENFLAKICFLSTDNYNDIILRSCLSNSTMLSADVNSGVDPNYEGVQDKRNASYMGKGIILQKYTGSRGKAGGSEANPEFIAKLRKIFNENNISWQTGEIGKVDKGGGGTIAQFLANLGVEVIDCGVAVLSMHSPFEITSKIDIYTMAKAYNVFYKNIIS
ncbi:MAG TPA: aminopeptidase [Pseudobacteroides sp.]|nr:aminopeptidase [Pseudobacteroides sp.]